MTFATIVFGFIVAFMIGSGFHLWKGGGAMKLIQYLLLSVLGFWSGQAIAALLQVKFLPVGALAFGFNVTGSLLMVFLGYWLGNQKPDTNHRHR